MRIEQNWLMSVVSKGAALGAMSILLSACGGGGSDSTPASSAVISNSPSTPTTPSTPATNTAPAISGSPSATAAVGQAYSFQPSASDQEGDTLGFTITNKPSWASFNSATGALTGSPTAAGTSSGIVITVSDGRLSTSLASFSIVASAAPVTPPANSAPTISGAPSTTVTVGAAYNFQPSASDQDGDTLSYTITNKPAWATFSTTTGALTGTPSAAGTFANIMISVSDGKASTALTGFTIVAAQAATSSATLSWVAPTQNSDGSTLSDLGGYRVYYGTSSSSLTNTVDVSGGSSTSTTITGLIPGTYYFAVKSYTTGSVESDMSNVASKVIP